VFRGSGGVISNTGTVIRNRRCVISNKGKNILDSAAPGRYSPLEHIAKAVFGLSWREVTFAVYAAYYDCSGRDDDGARSVTVACWGASVEQWMTFETEWRAVLERYEVPYFRMAEFAHFQGPFAEWKDNEPRRRAFLNDLATVIDNTTQTGYAAYVPQAVFEGVDARLQLRETFYNAFVFAARRCTNHIYWWLEYPQGVSRRYWSNSIRHVFDQGDDWFGHLRVMLEEEGFTSPIPEQSWDDVAKNKRGVVQLQASDWLAYEAALAFAKMPFPKPARGSFRRLVWNRSILMEPYSDFMIELVAKERGVPPRQ